MIDDDRAGLRVHRRLTEQTQEWMTTTGIRTSLSGAPLVQAREWAETHEQDANADERTFLAASIEAEKDAPRRRTASSVLTVALLVVGTLAVIASSQRARANQA